MVWQWVCVLRLLIWFSTAFYWNLFETKIGFSIGLNIELATFFECLYFQLAKLNFNSHFASLQAWISSPVVNMSAEFDIEAHNILVSIMFTSLFPYIPIVTLTFDLQNQ